MKEQEINRYWKKIIDTMNEGLILIAPSGRIIMVNKAFERLTGFNSKEVLGKPCTILNCDQCVVQHSQDEKAHGPWCNLFHIGEEDTKRCTIIRKDGAYLPILKNASLLTDEEGNILGAVETLTDISELDRLDREIIQLSRRLCEEAGFRGIVGKSKAMDSVFEVIEKAAQSDAPVIIYGESGTGKELVAKAIHELGPRKNGPFVQLNCAALNEALLESELFGHTRGAFTGAYRHRIGRFEAANGGDIFLDEIGDIPLSIQVKLLRVLEAKEFERVGDHTPVSVDVRIISATNKDLQELVAKRLFRQDLFFRINVIPIFLPPLRERKDDIPLLTEHFIKLLRQRTGKDITGISQETMEVFMAYHWPGNVRELRSTLEYAFVIGEKGLITPNQLPPHIGKRSDKSDPNKDPREATQKEALVEALRKAGGNQSKAARLLGVSRVTVWNRMKKYGIDIRRIMVES